MRKLGHWTPRYVFNRLRNKACHLIHPDWPWLTPEAVGFLRNWLRPSDRVFEWGAGRSTIWIARRVHSIVSVETDAEWLRKVRSNVQKENLRNVDLKFVPVNSILDDGREYVACLAAADGPFDLIIVDSLYRDNCALLAIDYLRPGGLLLIDNINWFLPCASVAPVSRRQDEEPATPQWKDFSEKVKAWRQLWSSNGVWDTAVWVKPTC